MSPERKFKSDTLLNQRDVTAASAFDEDASEIRKTLVREVKAAENSKKRLVKTTILGGESTLFSRGKSKKPGSKIEFVQSIESPTTPKTNAANKQEYSPLPSFSPIDYRPQCHDANDADCPETTSMLKSYVEQWTKLPSDDDTYDDYDDTIDKGVQTILDMNCTDSTGSHDGPLPSSWENNVPSPAMAYENLAVEYGRLALLKQELDRNIQVRELDARAHGGFTEISERPNPQVAQYFSTTTSDRENDMGYSTPGLRESLEHVYGQLTFSKRQLECKMHMQNHDARNLYPLIPRASFPETTYDNALVIQEGVAGPDETPSREYVAFGEMAYRQRVAELGMVNILDRSTDDNGHPAINYKGQGGIEERLPAHRRVEKNNFAEHHPDHYYKNCDIANERSLSKVKTKKKRKRRVIETITRVIHEESEEEGSASTRGGGHGWNLKEHRPRTGSSEKHHRDDRQIVYRGKVPHAGPSNYRRERIFSLKREARKPRNPGRDYKAYGDSDSDS
jgi:hypothetical protein